MRVLFAFDSFKGTMGSLEAGRVAAAALQEVSPDVEVVVAALADGGEGTTEAVHTALGGEYREVQVTGPLRERQWAKYLLLPSGTAVIEMAQAAGLPLVPEAARNPLLTTTYGVGEMICDALDRGAREIYVGVGGSATVDGGAGCAAALGVRFLDAGGKSFVPTGGTLNGVAEVDAAARDPRIAGTRIAVLCDVTNPLLGEKGAARVFGPQKGAGPDDVVALEEGLRHLAHTVGERGAAAAEPGAGAAGGLAWGLSVFLGAELSAGAAEVMRLTDLAKRVHDVNVVVTGEGSLDAQTLGGKAPFVLAEAAREAGARLIGIGGSIDAAIRRSGVFDVLLSMSEEVGRDNSISHPGEALCRVVSAHARDIIGI